MNGQNPDDDDNDPKNLYIQDWYDVVAAVLIIGLVLLWQNGFIG